MMETVKICDVDVDDDICRLCLVKCRPEEVRHWGLFATDLPQKLMAFAAVQIQENDGLPTFICTNCRNLVYASYNFKCQVEKSDHDLRQALLLKQSPKDWQNITNVKPMEGLSNVDMIVPCYQKSFNSCMSMQDEHSTSNHEQFIFEIENSCNLASDTYKKQDVIVLNNPVDAVSQMESHALQISNGMSRSDNNVILAFGSQYEMRDNVLEKPVSNFQPQILQEKSNHSDDDKPLILRTKRHKCNYCIKSFANLNLLAKHAVIHKRTVYLCNVCEEEFSSLESVQNHHITIHNVQIDKDKIVDKVRWPKTNNGVQKNNHKSIENLLAQSNVKPIEAKFSCEICFRHFTHYRTYSFHMKNHPEYHNKPLPKNNHMVTVEKSSIPSLASDNSLQAKNIESNSNLVNLNNSSDLDDLERLSDSGSLRLKSSTSIISQPTSADLDLQASLDSNFGENICRIGNESSRNTSENGIPDFDDDFDDDDDDEDDESDDNNKKSDDTLKENSSIECKQCGKLVATVRNLKRHMLTHTGLKHNCSICGKDFSRPDKLREHQQLKHKNEVFGKSDTENESDYESSRKKDKKNRPYKCSMCPKSFAQAQSLTNHEERHKRDKEVQKRFLCEVCSKCFAQSGSLVAHMRTHTGVKPYVCNVCSRAFTKSTYLQLHLRIHSGEKPYVCQYCNRAFARANTLARHLTMHTGEAKYQCQICSKSFRRLTSLNEHTFTHTGQRPYSCKICDKRYNNAGSLYAHTKKCKTVHVNSASLNDYPDSLDLPDNGGGGGAVPQSETNSPAQLLIFAEDKKDDVMMGNESIAAEPSSCQFMIANIHDQKTMPVNMIESFIMPESDVYNIAAKQFKTPYYGLYPSM